MHYAVGACIPNVTNKERGRCLATISVIGKDDWLKERFYERFDEEARMMNTDAMLLSEFLSKFVCNKIKSFSDEHNIVIKEEKPLIIDDGKEYKITVIYTIEYDR